MKIRLLMVTLCSLLVIACSGNENNKAVNDVKKVADINAVQERWGVYTLEKDTSGKGLACWVCQSSTAGTASCPVKSLIPDTDWDEKEQAQASACVLKRNGKCGEVKNYSCPAP